VTDGEFSILKDPENKRRFDEICFILQIAGPETFEGRQARGMLVELVNSHPDSLALNVLYAYFLYGYSGPLATRFVLQNSLVKDHSVIRAIIALVHCAQGQYEEAIQEFYNSEDKDRSNSLEKDALLSQALDRKQRQEIDLDSGMIEMIVGNPFLSPDHIQMMFEEISRVSTCGR